MQRLLITIALIASLSASALAQSDITPVYLSIGRSFPVKTPVTITRVSVALPEIADVVVTSERDLVINGRATGETDAIVWLADGSSMHYRISVKSAADRMQVVLCVKLAEVRRSVIQNLGVSVRYGDANTRVGTGRLATDDAVTGGSTSGGLPGISIPASTPFVTVLSTLGSDRLLALLDAEEQLGNARTLAEPNLMAANNQWATFLAGGELPIPVAQGGVSGLAQSVTIVFREFGIRMRFQPEILDDSLIRLTDSLEVSDLDFTNAVTVSGFRVPALRTRKIQSTVDVRRNQSLILSGMFNNTEDRVKTGVPILMHLPIIGALFSSTSFQRNETELVVVVTPVVVDPRNPRPQDLAPMKLDSLPPAMSALARPPAGSTSGAPIPIPPFKKPPL
jgi:pilus assembly protein CpaC